MAERRPTAPTFASHTLQLGMPYGTLQAIGDVLRNHFLEVGQEGSHIETGRRFHVRRQQGVGLVAVGAEECPSHFLELAPSNAGKGLGVIVGDKDGVPAPRSGLSVRPAGHVPHVLSLRADGKLQPDVEPAK